MVLSGYKRNQGSLRGGIQSIELVAASAIADVEYDPVQKSCMSITLISQAQFVCYRFKEDQAVYGEQVNRRGGVKTVAHRLSFVLERLDEALVKAVEEIAEASSEGIVALICMANGERFLVGVSEKFGLEKPLRLIKSTGATGSGPADITGETVVIASEDCDKAMPFAGRIITA